MADRSLPTPVSAGSGSAGHGLLPTSQPRHSGPPGMAMVYAGSGRTPSDSGGGDPRRENGWRRDQGFARRIHRPAPVAQLDRALPSEGRGHWFESSRVHHSPAVSSTRLALDALPRRVTGHNADSSGAATNATASQSKQSTKAAFGRLVRGAELGVISKERRRSEHQDQRPRETGNETGCVRLQGQRVRRAVGRRGARMLLRPQHRCTFSHRARRSTVPLWRRRGAGHRRHQDRPITLRGAHGRWLTVEAFVVHVCPTSPGR